MKQEITIRNSKQLCLFLGANIGNTVQVGKLQTYIYMCTNDVQ